MAIDPAAPTTRRALLAASVAALTASVAQALGRPLATRAANGDPVLVGGEHEGTTATRFRSTAENVDGIAALAGTGGAGVRGQSAAGYGLYGSSYSSTAVYGLSNFDKGIVGRTHAPVPGVEGWSDGSGVGVYGASTAGGSEPPAPQKQVGVLGYAAQGQGSRGVMGISTSGAGVYGTATSGAGVYGEGTSGNGVVAFSKGHYGISGHSASPNHAGVVGRSGADAQGVFGLSGLELPEAMPAMTGVFGWAAQDATSSGVVGMSPAGAGVKGATRTGRGVRGVATSGIGLDGEATTGLALRTKGRVRFDGASGRSKVLVGHASVTVTPGVVLTTNSSVIATLNGNAGGTTTVRRVHIDVANGRFTIVLTKASTATVRVAWMVLG